MLLTCILSCPLTLYLNLCRVKNCGMNFEWSLFEFTKMDCANLSKALKACRTLRLFQLRRSHLDDPKGRLLISHLLDHSSLTTLGISKYLLCKIVRHFVVCVFGIICMYVCKYVHIYLHTYMPRTHKRSRRQRFPGSLRKGGISRNSCMAQWRGREVEGENSCILI